MITYRTGGIDEIVEATGYGVIVEQGNTKDLVEAILTVKKSLNEKVCVFGRSEARQHHAT